MAMAADGGRVIACGALVRPAVYFEQGDRRGQYRLDGFFHGNAVFDAPVSAIFCQALENDRANKDFRAKNRLA